MEKIDQIVKELEYNFKGNRRYQTILFIADAPGVTSIKEIQTICSRKTHGHL